MLSGDQIVLHIVTDGIFQSGRCGLPSRGLEAADVSTGVVLVLVTDVIRNVDELDLGFAVQRREERRSQIDPGARGAGCLLYTSDAADE